MALRLSQSLSTGSPQLNSSRRWELDKGKAASLVAPAAAEKIVDRQPAEKAPVTLRGLPVAATPNSNGDVIEQMSRLSGQAYQDAFAKLSPQQRRSLVDE